jgi:transcriptional regulator with XRE-family HTH domain
LSQEELAFEADVNRSYMSRLEKGASYPGLEIIGKLSIVLEIEPAELLKLPSKKASAGVNVNLLMGGHITPFFTHKPI